MNIYTVSGITVATAATIDHAIGVLWNPSTTKRIYLKQIHIAKSAVGAADIPRVARTTTIGTAGSTITPTIVNHHDRDLAPPSVAALGLAAYSAQPVIEALRLHSWYIPASIGAGIMWVFDPVLAIPEGAGIGLFTGSALAFPVSTVGFTWEE